MSIDEIDEWVEGSGTAKKEEPHTDAPALPAEAPGGGGGQHPHTTAGLTFDFDLDEIEKMIVRMEQR